jgi:hypothetical protein
MACPVWAEDALSYAHAVPTFLFDQQKLVPDEVSEPTAAILQEGGVLRPGIPCMRLY